MVVMKIVSCDHRRIHTTKRIFHYFNYKYFDLSPVENSLKNTLSLIDQSAKGIG